jgi:hypothetical protein
VYSNAVPMASIVLLHRMNMQALENVSVMVNIELYPWEIGNLTMKSIATEVKGRVKLSEGMGKGAV